jgi:membrane protease YdiL (CAAX protease family)
MLETDPLASPSALESPVSDSSVFDAMNAERQEEPPTTEPALFQSFSQPEVRPPVRTPNLGDVAILGVFVSFGLLCVALLLFLALHFHLFGISTQDKAATDIHYNLGSEAALYLFTFGVCLLFFPLIWHKSFFAGLQWNGAVALTLRKRLFITAFICFVLALINAFLLPGPSDAPIDKIFRTPGAAWLLFGFGVTFAPFFEELTFRGFLLPAFCTGADWIAEKVSGEYVPVVDASGRPRWPVGAISVVFAVFASIPIVVTGALHFLHLRAALLVLLFYFLGLISFLVILARRKNTPIARERLFEANEHPIWSMPSMVIASVFVSLPFALMHAEQTGYSWGPLLLLVGVSLVLCWARLSTRSLAASVIVHSSYNFLLFFLMMLGTSGFRHLEKM